MYMITHLGADKVENIFLLRVDAFDEV